MSLRYSVLAPPGKVPSCHSTSTRECTHINAGCFGQHYRYLSYAESITVYKDKQGPFSQREERRYCELLNRIGLMCEYRTNGSPHLVIPVSKQRQFKSLVLLNASRYMGWDIAWPGQKYIGEAFLRLARDDMSPLMLWNVFLLAHGAHGSHNSAGHYMLGNDRHNVFEVVSVAEFEKQMNWPDPCVRTSPYPGATNNGPLRLRVLPGPHRSAAAWEAWAKTLMEGRHSVEELLHFSEDLSRAPRVQASIEKMLEEERKVLEIGMKTAEAWVKLGWEFLFYSKDNRCGVPSRNGWTCTQNLSHTGRHTSLGSPWSWDDSGVSIPTIGNQVWSVSGTLCLYIFENGSMQLGGAHANAKTPPQAPAAYLNAHRTRLDVYYGRF